MTIITHKQINSLNKKVCVQKIIKDKYDMNETRRTENTLL